MARTDLAAEDVTRAGLDLTLAAANVDGHAFNADPRVCLVVDNADAAPITVTVVTPGTVSGQAIADLAVTVPAGESRYIGPFTSTFTDPVDRKVDVDFSAVANVTVGLLRIP